MKVMFFYLFLSFPCALNATEKQPKKVKQESTSVAVMQVTDVIRDSILPFLGGLQVEKNWAKNEKGYQTLWLGLESDLKFIESLRLVSRSFKDSIDAWGQRGVQAPAYLGFSSLFEEENRYGFPRLPPGALTVRESDQHVQLEYQLSSSLNLTRVQCDVPLEQFLVLLHPFYIVEALSLHKSILHDQSDQEMKNFQDKILHFMALDAGRKIEVDSSKHPRFVALFKSVLWSLTYSLNKMYYEQVSDGMSLMLDDDAFVESVYESYVDLQLLGGWPVKTFATLSFWEQVVGVNHHVLSHFLSQRLLWSMWDLEASGQNVIPAANFGGVETNLLLAPFRNRVSPYAMIFEVLRDKLAKQAPLNGTGTVLQSYESVDLRFSTTAIMLSLWSLIREHPHYLKSLWDLSESSEGFFGPS